MEAMDLLSFNKYTEKQIGYLFISLLVNSNSDLIWFINNAIKNDLASHNPILPLHPGGWGQHRQPESELDPVHNEAVQVLSRPNVHGQVDGPHYAPAQ